MKKLAGYNKMLKVIFVVAFAFVNIVFVSVHNSYSSPLYIQKDSRGSVTFTTKKPKGGNFEEFKPRQYSFSIYKVSSKGYRRRGSNLKLMKSNFDELIHEASVSAGIDPVLVKAVVQVESGFNPKAKSPKGAKGLMQLMPATAKRFGVEDPYHPEQNIKGGTTYLKFLLKRYKGDERLAVAAYNAGEGAVDQYGKSIPPYEETINYVSDVMRLKNIYLISNSNS